MSDREVVITGMEQHDLQSEQDREKFRGAALGLQARIEEGIEEGALYDVLPDCTLRHFFVDRSEKYGCFTYAREYTMPAGALIVGKIHRHQHLNFITVGKIAVATEFGRTVYEAPVTFISNPGTKRAVLALEDTVWTTVHLTALAGEENLDEIEDELVAPDFDSLGMNVQAGDYRKLIEEVMK